MPGGLAGAGVVNGPVLCGALLPQQGSQRGPLSSAQGLFGAMLGFEQCDIDLSQRDRGDGCLREGRTRNDLIVCRGVVRAVCIVLRRILQRLGVSVTIDTTGGDR